MSLPGESQALKDAGNTEFKKGNYKKALELYSKACKLAPNNAVLWANSAACSLNLKRYADAEAQARKAIAADPSFAKGYGRLGAALSSLNKYDDAIDAYEQAIPLLHASEADQKLRTQYNDAIVEITTRVMRSRENVRGASAGRHAEPDYTKVRVGDAKLAAMNKDGGEFPWDAAERYIESTLVPELQAGEEEAWNSSAWLLYVANNAWTQGVETMKRTVKRGDMIMGTTGAVTDLSEAVMMTDRILRFDSEFLTQYKHQMQFEGTATNAFLSLDDNLESLQHKLPSIIASKGWDFVRPALTVTVRGWFNNGIFLQILGASFTEKRLSLLRWAAEMTEWLPKRYPDVPLETLGKTFQPTVTRALLNAYGNALVTAYKSTHPTQETLDKIRSVGERVVKNCEDHPIPVPDSAPLKENAELWGYYHGFQTRQLSEGYALQGFYYLRMAAKAGVIQADSDEAVTNGVKALELYSKAGNTLPKDDEMATWYYFIAIQAAWLTSIPVKGTLRIAKGIIVSYEKSREIWKRSNLGASGTLQRHYETVKSYIEQAEKILVEQGEDSVAVPSGMGWKDCL